MQRYSSFTGYYRGKYGERLQKVVIDAGFTCPNRDGTVGRGGCTYCDNAAFHPSYSTAGKPLHLQIDEGIEFHRVRYRNTRSYLAYFQSYSNTYAPLDRLKRVYEEALSHPSIVGIVIGTRPDCVDGRKLDWLASLACGTALPDVYGGFGTTLTYKGLDVAFDFNYQIGGQVYDSDYASMMGSPMTNGRGSNFHADLLKAWTPEMAKPYKNDSRALAEDLLAEENEKKVREILGL